VVAQPIQQCGSAFDKVGDVGVNSSLAKTPDDVPERIALK
jgi:hypothetical protein